MSAIDADWETFLTDGHIEVEPVEEEEKQLDIERPISGSLHVSTQTKIAYLTEPIDILDVFWKIPIMEFHEMRTGILKKQIKLTSLSREEVAANKARIEREYIGNLMVINEREKGDIYKCVQKASAGLSNKDVLTYKPFSGKRAFYNCFALVIRIEINEEFKEFHIKVFNTGKIEIPGIKDTPQMRIAMRYFLVMIKEYYPDIEYKDNIRTILINSNFNCGYEVERDKCQRILSGKYNLISMYDPCLYPGVQCKFYYNAMKATQDGICTCAKRCSKKGSGEGEGQCKEVSFMVFRTGSILIVGNCDEEQLEVIYEKLKAIFDTDYAQMYAGKQETVKTTLTKKTRSKTFIVNNSYKLE
jgi:TATA-box binding protein (TBP) (component of TFIID and TFIIIB)